ncbi:hypothetical protein [Stutzerimonas zhaodongensis]|nr:hypothetical protein [Stutzerimonas zhaodongensis]
MSFITRWWMAPDVARLYQVQLGDQPEVYLGRFIGQLCLIAIGW